MDVLARVVAGGVCAGAILLGLIPIRDGSRLPPRLALAALATAVTVLFFGAAALLGEVVAAATFAFVDSASSPRWYAQVLLRRLVYSVGVIKLHLLLVLVRWLTK